MYDYYDYDDKSTDEILESMVIDINNLFNEMDITIIKANYIYLRENGEEMPPNKRAKVAGEVKEGILKKVWNRITDSVKAAKDTIIKIIKGERYNEEELAYIEKGFDILVKDKSIKFDWNYTMVKPTLILHKPAISDGLINNIMKITPDDDYKAKFNDYLNKLNNIFAKTDGQSLPLMIKKQELLFFCSKDAEKMVSANLNHITKMSNDFKKLFNKKTAPKDFLKLSAIIAEELILQPSYLILATDKYCKQVAKACIRLGKQAVKDKSRSANESYMFDTVFDTFDDLYY